MTAKVQKTKLTVYASYVSRSDGGVRHRVYQNDQGQVVTCSCKGWVYNRKCWHVEKARSNKLKKLGVE